MPTIPTLYVDSTARRAADAATVYIVDPCQGDYQNWQSSAANRGIGVRTFRDATGALRAAREHHPDLWVINTQLPGTSGTDLCRMLRQQEPRAAIALVSVSPSVAEEQAAWAARPTLFGDRAGQAELIDSWWNARLASQTPGHARRNSQAAPRS